jgi:4-amino-4-deoxy-L-arabinose transferase-like glycosyltransferase
MKKLRTELIILVIIFLLFIFLRSFHFSYFLNWSQDQAESGIAALKIWKEKKLTLIGPQISATYQGRLLFQGPATYYLFLLFLLLGQWDPVKASYFFMLFSGLMLFILYFGVKKLINKKAAWLAVLIYSFFPYYLNYTRFLWNSTLQFSLLPILIFLWANYKEKKSAKNLFFLSVFLGLLAQFHYQFVLVLLGFFGFLLVKKVELKKIVIYIFGVAIGLSPLILFELKHQFYNTQTALLFLQNWSKVDKPGNATMPHYYLSLSFLLLITILLLFKNSINKLNKKFIVGLGLILFTISFLKNYQKPKQSYWAPAKFWNYPMEKKAYQIIKKTGLQKDFNVADLSYYNTKAAVIKYFLLRDGYRINYDDYYQNHYLFVISHNKEYEKALSYEVAFFKPRKLINQWQLNDYYQLYLFERINEKK